MAVRTSVGRMASTLRANAPVNPATSALKALAGRWVAEIRWSEKTHKLVGGAATVRTRVSFNWIEDDNFLVKHMGSERERSGCPVDHRSGRYDRHPAAVRSGGGAKTSPKA